MSKVTRREDETLDEMLKRFKTKVKKSGVMNEVRLREFFMPKKQRIKMKHDLNKKK